jgi:Protein of unknown function (DUF1997)
MRSHFSESRAMEATDMLDTTQRLTDTEEPTIDIPQFDPVRFHGQFSDCMVMYADAATIAEYLSQHSGWFCRCAHPMTVLPLDENGYALTIGKFSSFGYEVEPKIGLVLLPPDRGIYPIKTIPVPDYTPPGYDVDFNAAMQLLETPDAPRMDNWTGAITRVEWELDLVVAIAFPRFIYRLPMSLIQSTGDRLLRQIVRQVSRRLTRKVQQDFHTSLGLPIPKKGHR